MSVVQSGCKIIVEEIFQSMSPTAPHPQLTPVRPPKRIPAHCRKLPTLTFSHKSFHAESALHPHTPDRKTLHNQKQKNRFTTTSTKISIVRSMIGTVTARYTTRSSKSAIEKTANTCDRRAAHCHKIVYTIYFFAWDNSPTSLDIIISNSLLFLLFVATQQMPDSKHRKIQQHPRS